MSNQGFSASHNNQLKARLVQSEKQFSNQESIIEIFLLPSGKKSEK